MVKKSETLAYYAERITELLEHASKPLTQAYVKKITGIAPREQRTAIKHVNDRFNRGEVDYMIIGTRYGNLLTRDVTLIRAYNNAKRAHALSELKSAYDCDKRVDNDLHVYASLFD